MCWEQGLLQAWNFNQPEALRAFELAAEEDSTAAMVYWGQAYALGPGANRYADDYIPSLLCLTLRCNADYGSTSTTHRQELCLLTRTGQQSILEAISGLCRDHWIWPLINYQYCPSLLGLKSR